MSLSSFISFSLYLFLSVDTSGQRVLFYELFLDGQAFSRSYHWLLAYSPNPCGYVSFLHFFFSLSISSSLILQGREYWLIYRGPGYLAVVWFGSSPTPVSKLDRRHTGRLRKRDNFLTGEGGRGGWPRGKSYDRKEAWSSIIHSILSISGSKPLSLPGVYVRACIPGGTLCIHVSWVL